MPPLELTEVWLSRAHLPPGPLTPGMLSHTLGCHEPSARSFELLAREHL